MADPIFRYCIPGNPGVVDALSSLWNLPLSGGPENNCNDNLSNGRADRFLIKDYFESAKIFIEQNRYSALKKGLKFYGKKDISCSSIHYIDISLEKHGAFYHPARISVMLEHGEKFFFVLNMAVSDPGLAIIENEYRSLSKLNKDHPDSFLPKVFAMGIVPMEKGNIAFFMAQWFEGFHEFHVTSSPAGKQIKEEQIGVWESDGSIVKISLPWYLVIYEKAAEILTEFYNIKTFEQIFPWHHAAGDFVVKRTDTDFYVRLITVRGYSPLFETDSDQKDMDNENMLQALLFFLINLSLRMRIDRMDGTGDYYFMDSGIISAVLKGFFRAVSKKNLPGVSGKNISKIFLEFIINFSAEEIYEMCAIITDSYNPHAPEIALIKKNLKKHSKVLFDQIRRI